MGNADQRGSMSIPNSQSLFDNSSNYPYPKIRWWKHSRTMVTISICDSQAIYDEKWKSREKVKHTALLWWKKKTLIKCSRGWYHNNILFILHGLFHFFFQFFNSFIDLSQPLAITILPPYLNFSSTYYSILYTYLTVLLNGEVLSFKPFEDNFSISTQFYPAANRKRTKISFTDNGFKFQQK